MKFGRNLPLATFGSERVKRVNFYRENVRAFFPQGQSKLSVIKRWPYWAGVRKAEFDCIWTNILCATFGVSLLSPSWCDRFGQIKKEKSWPSQDKWKKCRTEAINWSYCWRSSSFLGHANVFGMYIPLQMSIANDFAKIPQLVEFWKTSISSQKYRLVWYCI